MNSLKAMKHFARVLLCLVFAVSLFAQPPAPAHKWAVVLHGGAGVIERGKMTPEHERAYRAGLEQALRAAAAVLEKGGSSLDAVESAIQVLEDDPNFNAGRGAVFAADGTNQLDAAIMDGATLRAGAVADVTRTRHPISLARAVMEHSGHVMLIGPGADEFAATRKLEQVEPSFFFTEPRWQNLLHELKQKGLPIPPRPKGAPPAPAPAGAERSTAYPASQVIAAKSAARTWGTPELLEPRDAHKYGTVGVVALDRQGNLAGGTSTGGLTAKRWNRVGDSPIIGAGTYASNRSCAVSGTGAGEYFIRLTVARSICALVEYKGMSVQAAADEVIQKQLTALGGDGGIIALTPDGQMAWSFNTPGMFRARISEGGAMQMGIYKDEP
jgi:beta-aspartyl-peptidase (threonine type)